MEAALSARSASLGMFDLVEDLRNRLFLDRKADRQSRQRGFSARGQRELERIGTG